MSIRKRALSLLLVLVMLLGVLPAGAAAAEVYQDVPSGHWASDYIARVAEQGLMVGTSDTTFAPEETITRAMFVTILARYAKAETDNNAETAFADVPAGQYYTGAVAWAAANGIVNGTSAVTFAPNDPVTREQMAALLYRAMRFLGNKCPQDGKLDAFSDASALSDWAVEGMIWAAGAGLFGGFEDGTLRPQETATRAQAAKVFCVLLDYSEQPEPTEPSAEPTEPSEEPTQEPTAEPTDPTEPTEPETGFTVTFKGEGGYAKVNGEKVTSVTLEPGVNWLNFNLYGDHSEGFDLDQVAASSGTLQRVRSEFILRDITEDVTVTFTTTGMIVTVTFVSKQVATVTPEKVQVPWGQTVEPATAERSGYTFVSWTTEDGTPFDFSQPVREDVTLYATWKVRMYVVTYYDGENVLYTQEYSYGSVIDRPTSPSKEGYLFTGWFKDPELTQMFDFIDRCRGDMSLYAKWREDDRSDYIYLDGTDGDDANDGTTEESAVKTFERAKSLLAESKNPVILICGTVTITQDTTWTMADLEGGKVMRAGSFTKRMIVIEPEAEDASATLTLENITLDGGATMWPELLTQNMVWYILDIEAGGRLVLNSGATVQNSAASSRMVGGAIYVTGSGFNCGTVEMNEGAKIINNYGGYMSAIAGSAGAHITINGGLISGNKATNTGTTLPHRGSAVGVSSGNANAPGILTINGGIIENNESLMGCAVSLAQHAVGYLNGGIIRNNVSGTYAALVAYGNSGSSTWYLNGGTIENNTPGAGYPDDQVAMLEKSQVVFGAEKDALTFSGLYLNTERGALPVAIAKPLSNVTGGGVRVTLDYMGTDIVLAIGYGTYKLTAEDTKAYQLVNSLDPYYKAEIDAANNRYCVVSAQVIGAEVYMNDSTMSTNPGNDANDGLTPQTPVATFARAKEILKANAKEKGDNIIYIMNGGTLEAGTSEVWSLEGIPNAMLSRYLNGSTGSAVWVEGELTLENITLDGLCMYTPQTRSTSAFVRVDEGGTLNVKAGTVVRNMRGSSQVFVWSFSRAGKTNTVNVEDVTVTNCQTYSSSNSETGGAAVFAMYGQSGSSVLNLKNGTFTNNQARLVHVSGGGTHTINIENATFTNNSVKGCGAIFLMDQSNAGNASAINVYGGTFMDNACLLSSTSYGSDSIARLKSPGALHFYGGTFANNTTVAGKNYEGIYLRDVSQKLGSNVYVHKLSADLNVYLTPYSAKVFMSRIVVDSALTHTISVYIADNRVPAKGMPLVVGTDEYKLSEADLAMVKSANPKATFYLDTENNAICIAKAE